MTLNDLFGFGCFLLLFLADWAIACLCVNTVQNLSSDTSKKQSQSEQKILFMSEQYIDITT